MIIGIHAKGRFKERTGVEEYVYQLIKHLALDESTEHKFTLYTPTNSEAIFICRPTS